MTKTTLRDYARTIGPNPYRLGAPGNPTPKVRKQRMAVSAPALQQTAPAYSGRDDGIRTRPYRPEAKSSDVGTAAHAALETALGLNFLPDEVIVEGSFFKRADLPVILGTYIRATAAAQREAKAALVELDHVRRERNAAEAKLAAVQAVIDDEAPLFSRGLGLIADILKG